eukprot:1867454-Pyramimonas_sp.AAC.1
MRSSSRPVPIQATRKNFVVPTLSIKPAAMSHKHGGGDCRRQLGRGLLGKARSKAKRILPGTGPALSGPYQGSVPVRALRQMRKRG